ncbi:UNVERIFIED_CONTAM: hypothetical protein GTU68_035902 [Idotea baltica]|nr:hypothetical protein [Idotea baltica]
MTAFANNEKRLSDKQESEVLLSWEIRSVNHRYLDASVYLPESFLHQEAQLKDILRKKLGRGKVDAKLRNLKINEDLVKNLFEAQHTLMSLSKNDSSEQLAPLSSMQILQFPGVLENSELDFSQYNKQALLLFKQTLDILIKSREEEGQRLQEMLSIRAAKVKEIVAQVRTRRPKVVEALREKVLNKISDLEIETDNSRLEQELAIQAQRLDVDEELDRLDSHVEELFAVLDRDEPVGRRLDFLMQELNREANTLGSKANDAETTKASVELKVLIEQMREQVMNIE